MLRALGCALLFVPALAQASAEERLTSHGIRLEGGHWPLAVVEELARGLDHLPPALRSPPGGLTLVYSPQAAAFGMGDDSEGTPRWSQGRFHLYAYAPSTERRAEYRVERLSGPQREALWRRRALVHAVLQRWDEARGWSREKAWRRLNGWLSPWERVGVFSEQAVNKAPWAYSRSLGQRSASLDLITFAEEALVPAESFGEHLLEEADQVRCQEFSKSRFLRERAILTAPRGRCDRFDAWADPASLEGFEFLFVAASGRAPESLFGHLLLRIERRNEGWVQGPGLTPAVQLVALTGGDLPGPAYVARGLFGGYPLVLMTVPMLDVTRQMLEYEQRTMRRHRLRLTAGEAERLFERIWELERRARLDYRFLHDNCAFAAAFLVNGALEEGREIALPSRLSPLLPAATLDAVARVESGQGGSLLEAVPGPLASTRERARTAHARRAEAGRQLDSLLGAPAMASRPGTESADPQVRLSAYEAMASDLPESLSPAAQEALFAFLAHSVAMERWVFDEAEALAIKAHLSALKGSPPVPAGESEAETRARQFEREAALEGAMAVLDRPQRAQQMLESLPRRAFTAHERRQVDAADAAARRLDALLALQTRVVQHATPSVDPVAWWEADRARTAAADARLHAQALAPSGYGRLTVSAGASQTGGRLQPVVRVRSAAFSEELGDQRLHGLDPASELTTLTGELEWTAPGLGVPRVRRSEFIAAAYRNIRREPAPFRDEWTDALGWGFAGGYRFDAARAYAQRAFLTAEALAVLEDRAHHAHLAVLGLGAYTALGLEGLRPELLAGPRLTFLHRRPLGGSAHALKLGAEYALVRRLTSGQWEHSLGGHARWEQLLRLGRSALLVNVTAQLELHTEPKQRLEWSPTLLFGVEPLAF